MLTQDQAMLEKQGSSNRTFMELKCLFHVAIVTSKIVLIVPLWN